MKSFMEKEVATFRQKVFEDFSLTSLKVAIILWALFVIVLVLFVNNKWILAGILAYEVLP